MPSLIPNYIARFRTQSQSTAASSSSQSGSRSNSTAGPPTPVPEHARPAAELPLTGPTEPNLGSTPPTQVAQKIHPDLSSLLEEAAPPESAAEPLGPRPPRASRSIAQLASTNPAASKRPDQGAAEADIKLATSSASPRSPLLSRILTVPLLGGVKPISTPNPDAEPDVGGPSTHWSTFGRHHSRTSAVGEFGSLHRRGSRSSAHSKKSASRRGAQTSAPVTPTATLPPSARTSTLSRPQTIETPPSQPESPAGTMSSSSGSKSYSAPSHSVHSRRPPQAHAETILDTEPPVTTDPQTPASAPYIGSVAASPFTPVPELASPRPTRPTLDESPHTFGRATSRRLGASSRQYPALTGAFLPPLTSTPPPPEHQHSYSTREPPLTYPLRSGTRHATHRSTISFPSLPFALSQSRSRAEDVLQKDDHDRERWPSTFGPRFRFGSLRNGEGEGTGRRKSAEWSAAEAVRNKDGGEGESWLATVSKEMVRLSLADAGGGASVASVVVGAGEASMEAGETGALREGGAKNPTLFGSTGEDRWRFFRAGPKRAGANSAATASTPVAASQQSQSPAPLEPTFLGSTSTGLSAAGVGADGKGAHGVAPHVSVTAPTPLTSPRESRIGTMSDSGSTGSNLNGRNSTKSHGKRKIVDTEDEKPMDEHTIKPILNLRGGSREPSNRPSDASHAPSSYRNAKRIRLSTPSHSPARERPSRPQSRPTSPASISPSSLRTLPAHSANPRTLSQSSIPLRAIVSPRPPSIDRRGAYHMRDPALPPPRRQSTQWTGSARKREEEGRAFPLQAWAFIAGFLVFPFWWVAAVAPVGWGWGRRARGMQDGKGIWEQEDLAAREMWQYDVAYTWRRRCRLMSFFGLLVYAPLIVLLAVLVPRT